VLLYCRDDFMIKVRSENTGSALMVTVFAVAVLAVLTIGILQINTEELQIVRNQICAAEALATAEAGLNDAVAQIAQSAGWKTGFKNKAFMGGSYTVDVSSFKSLVTITSTGTTSQGFVARVGADVTIAAGTPNIVRIDKLRINE
jgi:Tfp pilus assembly protein PilX